MSNQTTAASSGIDRFFKITERGSTVGREVRGGLVTFFTMAYIIVLNPLILGFAHRRGRPVPRRRHRAATCAMIAAGTALVAGVMTILMGVVANFPLALATGLGLNAFVAFSIASQMTWADAMGLVVLEGLLILVLVLTGFREAVFHAVPAQLKIAISVGIGLFIALIGFVDAGFVRRIPDAAQTTVPGRSSGRRGQLPGWPVLVFCVGLLLVIALWVRRVKGAILISIVVDHRARDRRRGDRRLGRSADSRPAGASTCRPGPTTSSTPRTSARSASSACSARARASASSPSLLLVFTLMLADFFDTMGTMTAIGAEAGLLDEDGTPPNTQRILVVDSIAAAPVAPAGVSSQHVLHRVGLRRRRGRAHRPRLGRDRRAVPARDLLRAAGRR